MSSQYNQIATYWSKGTQNEYNEYTYSTPVAVAVRWEDHKIAFTDDVGREIISDAVVYPETELQVEGFIMLGASSEINPINEDSAYEIKQTDTTVNLRNTKTLYKAFLKR